METTETKFKKWCTKNKYFSKKLSATNDGGFKNRQESDFLVANFKGVYAVECKERESGRFSFQDLTQLKKLKLLEAKTDKIIPVILINFINEKTLVKLSLTDFIQLSDTVMFKNNKLKKSITLNDIPEKFKFNWKTLFI